MMTPPDSRRRVSRKLNEEVYVDVNTLYGKEKQQLYQRCSICKCIHRIDNFYRKSVANVETWDTKPPDPKDLRPHCVFCHDRNTEENRLKRENRYEYKGNKLV